MTLRRYNKETDYITVTIIIITRITSVAKKLSSNKRTSALQGYFVHQLLLKSAEDADGTENF